MLRGSGCSIPDMMMQRTRTDTLLLPAGVHAPCCLGMHDDVCACNGVQLFCIADGLRCLQAYMAADFSLFLLPYTPDDYLFMGHHIMTR